MKPLPLILGIGAVGGVAAAGYGVSTLVGGGGSSSEKNQKLQIYGTGHTSSSAAQKCKNVPFDNWSAPAENNEEFIEGADQESNLMFGGPNQTNNRTMKGCTFIQLSQENGQFSIESETRLLKGNAGMIFISHVSFADENKLNVSQFVLFLERSKGGHSQKWETKGGYGWGGREKLIDVGKLKLLPPGKNESVDLDSTEQNITSTWSTTGTQSPLEMSPEPYGQKSIHDNTFTFDPHKIRGYKETWLFAREVGDKEKTWRWGRYCRAGKDRCRADSSTEENAVDVTESIEAWYKLFKDQKGTWQ